MTATNALAYHAVALNYTGEKVLELWPKLKGSETGEKRRENMFFVSLICLLKNNRVRGGRHDTQHNDIEH